MDTCLNRNALAICLLPTGVAAVDRIRPLGGECLSADLADPVLAFFQPPLFQIFLITPVSAQVIIAIFLGFSFVGEEYRVQVGNADFSIDLLFYNRALSCLVAIELKIGPFRPEHLGQLNFYLEALDRDVKMPSENPSVGLILCAGKDDAIVEYALSRSMSPTMVAEYTLHLPDKKLLQDKLRELTELALDGNTEEKE